MNQSERSYCWFIPHPLAGFSLTRQLWHVWFLVGFCISESTRDALGVHTKRENPIKNLCNKKRTDNCVSTYIVFLKTFNRTNDFKYKNGTRVGQNLGVNCLRTGIENCVMSTMTVHEGKTCLYDAWNLFIHFSMALVSTYVSYCWSLIIESDPWDDDVVMMTQRRDYLKSHGHSMPMISEKDIYSKQTHIKLCLIDRDKFADKALVKPGNHSMDHTAFLVINHMHVQYIKAGIDWVVPQSVRLVYYGFSQLHIVLNAHLSCFPNMLCALLTHCMLWSTQH